MLEKLSGPFGVIDGSGGDVTLAESMATHWDEDLGIVSYATVAGLDCYCVVQIDGVPWPRSTYTREMPLLRDIPGAGLLAVDGLFQGTLYTFDKFSGTVTGTVRAAGTDEFHMTHARLPDRFLSFEGGHLYSLALADTSVKTLEFLFDAFWSAGTRATVSLTSDPAVLCFVWPFGIVAHYNWQTKLEVGTRMHLPVHTLAWFSARLNLFVLLDADLKLNLYAVTPRPFALSNPVPSPALRRGKKSTMTVQLTGENGEPCSGEVIEWAVDGVGMLSSLTSLTDIDGIAEVDYFATLDASSTTSVIAISRF